MDETNVNGIEVEDTEALIPEGWDGEGDFFDDASWDSPIETSTETEPAAEDSTPKVDPTTVEEETVEEEQEEAPTTEPIEDVPRKLKFTAKIDHNDLDVELDESELPDMYQKAQVVERVQSQMGKMKGTVDRATKLAKGMGFDDADSMLIAAAKNHLQNEIDRLVNDEEHPVNPEVAQDIMERRLGYTMKDLEDIEGSTAETTPDTAPTQPTAQAPTQGRDFQSEVQELLNAHPELVGTELPDEVAKAAVDSGDRLLVAYQKYARNSQARQVQSLVKENQVLKQNAESATRAPVTGVTGHGIEGNEPDDPFLTGFNSEAW